jgi:hypothetical protein
MNAYHGNGYFRVASVSEHMFYGTLYTEMLYKIRRIAVASL